MVVVYLTPNEICRKDAKHLSRKKDKSHKETKQSNKLLYQRRSKYRTKLNKQCMGHAYRRSGYHLNSRNCHSNLVVCKEPIKFHIPCNKFHKKETLISSFITV